jgi:hypothetical protein
MKKMTLLWSIVLALFALSACEKTNIPESQAGEIDAARKGGGGSTAVTPTATVTFGGQATGVNAIVVNTSNPVVTSNQTILAQTPLLPASGGYLVADAVSAEIAGVLTANTLNASITGQNGSTTSEASATGLSITISGNVISASSVHSTAIASCGATLSGKSVIENLVINGTPVIVTGAANQAVYLPGGGMIILNEQSVSRKAKPATITVTGIHIILPNGSDVRVASAKADIKC